jgi:transposase
MLRMNKIRTIIKIAQVEQKIRTIARAARVSRTAVENTLARIRDAGLTFSNAYELNDEALCEVIYPLKHSDENERVKKLRERIPYILKQLGKKHMTLQAQWEAYRCDYPDGYAYSRFCDILRAELNQKDVYLGMHYGYGEQMFIDYAGDKYCYIDRITGNKIEANLFVAILPASQYTFAEFTPSQKTVDWIGGSENAMRTIGGVPASIVPDCAKAVVNKAKYAESEMQFQYQLFADYYKTQITPARPRHPRDKALVESAVNNIYRWVYPRLAARDYYSIEELNTALRELMQAYNLRLMQQYKCSRREMFDLYEKSLLHTLPEQPYEYKEYQPPTKAAFNGHVWLHTDKHYYSIPERYIGRSCTVLYTSKNVEIYCENARIAMHMRDTGGKSKYTTVMEHLNARHSEYMKWTPERFQNWARTMGQNVETFVLCLIDRAAHPTHSYRSCMGLLSLHKPYGADRLDRACKIVLDVNGYSITRVTSVLEKGLDKLPHYEQLTLPGLPANNPNIRHAKILIIKEKTA